MPVAKLPPAMPLPQETPLPETPVRPQQKSNVVASSNAGLDDSLSAAMSAFSLKTPTAAPPKKTSLVTPKSSSTSKSKKSASNNSTATSSIISSMSSLSDMSICSPLPDLVPEDEELLWMEERRASMAEGTRTELVSNLAELLKRCVKSNINKYWQYN